MTCERCGQEPTVTGGCGCAPTGGPRDETWIRQAEEVQAQVRDALGEDLQIDQLLGRGGMSFVFSARRGELERPVALKVLPLTVSMDHDAADRFRREAKIASSLDHPHTVPVYDLGATPSFLWYTMKYIKGRSLQRILEVNGRLDLASCLDVVGQIAGALDYAHQQGVIHRDIKPGNVLVGEDGWVWLCDFGVAKSFGSVPLTQTGTAVGTPQYMSPEQFYGRTLDGSSDQYSLAVLVYECLAGQPPFLGDSFAEMVQKQCFETPAPLSNQLPDLPTEVVEAVSRALAKRPSERFLDVVEFVEALGGDVIDRGPRTHLDLLVKKTSAAKPAAPKAATTGVLGAVQRRGRRVLAAGVSVAVALAMAATVRGIQNRAPDPTNPTVPDTTVSSAVLSESLVEPPPLATIDSPTIQPQVLPSQPEPVVQRPTARPPRPAPSPEIAPARLLLYSEPWGYIYLNDSLVGETNVPPRDVAAGRYRLRIVRDGFHPHERDIVLEPGEMFRLPNLVLRAIDP